MELDEEFRLEARVSSAHPRKVRPPERVPRTVVMVRRASETVHHWPNFPCPRCKISHDRTQVI
ncbi:hypothetical protein Scep_019403 [Stephania cephalantha]|uniref:Uncharacterized protein n=1 Tax=Stephania cephalantha TaxID=152367 RepID=A0AAP0IAP9_9MAGN